MFHDKDTSSYHSFRVLWDVASKMSAITSFPLCICFLLHTLWDEFPSP